MAFMHSTYRLGLRFTLALVIASTLAAAAEAQQVAVKRSLSAASALPCPAAPAGTTPARNDSPDVRRLMSLGHEAAIVGDHRQARDVFADAARLSPGDERIAYQLARAYEELGERPNAVREYCRFLSLAPQAADAPDVRTRITALAAAVGPSGPADQGATAFRTGVAHIDQRRWREAVDAFGRTITALPRAAEAYYDRAVALAALQDREAAIRDYEQYLALRPSADDAQQVRAQIEALRKPTWSTSTALVGGLVLPGFGQVYTSRPWIGLGVAAVAGTSLALALSSKEEPEIRDYSVTIPGFPPIINVDTVMVTKQPYYAAGIAAFTTLTIAAAFEAARYARRSREAPLTGGRAPTARLGLLELFPPDVLPTRHGFALRLTGTVPLP
jgi:tetratricopeptide (TPR) repeat protein